MFDSQSQFYWRNGIADDGSEHRMCELEECSLFVDSEPNNMFSFTVTDKDDKVLRSVFDFPSPEKAQESAERGWKSCLKPTPRAIHKGPVFHVAYSRKWIGIRVPDRIGKFRYCCRPIAMRRVASGRITRITRMRFSWK